MSAVVNVSDFSEDAFNLKNLLDGIVEKVESIYQSYNVPLPHRRYWTLGTPAIDCEQLVVSFSQLYLGPPGGQISVPQRCNNPRTAIITINIARQVPVVGMNGRPPSPEKIQEASLISAVDAWVLMESMRLFDDWDNSGWGLGIIATVEAGEIEGGYQMVTMEITLAVP
jgi:hypothetical protein